MDSEIRTDRLLIRQMREDDWRGNQVIWRNFNRSGYAIYDGALLEGDAEVRKQTREFIGNGLFFSVFLAENETMIGYVCFHQDGDTFDLGYCFHSSFHGKGYAFESARAVMAFLVKERNARRFTAGTALDNGPSFRLLDRLGFRLVSTEIVSFDGDFSFLGGNFALENMYLFDSFSDEKE